MARRVSSESASRIRAMIQIQKAELEKKEARLTQLVSSSDEYLKAVENLSAAIEKVRHEDGLKLSDVSELTTIPTAILRGLARVKTASEDEETPTVNNDELDN